MTLPLLVAISVMWIPVAILFLGKGEAKGTGAVTGFVGVVVVFGAFLQAAVFKDPFTAGLLFVHGLLYCTVAYALLAGLQDLRSVGDVSLTVQVWLNAYGKFPAKALAVSLIAWVFVGLWTPAFWLLAAGRLPF